MWNFTTSEWIMAQDNFAGYVWDNNIEDFFRLLSDNVVDIVFNNYQNSGLLVRTNDSSQAYSNEDVIEGIFANISVLKTQGMLHWLVHEAPPYSASLLSGVNDGPPVLWYNPKWSEAFPDPPPPANAANKIGNRTLVAVIFNNGEVLVRGATPWDADSDLRDLGNIPNTQNFNKATPASLIAELSVFDGVGLQNGFESIKATSNNNNPAFNPLFFPRTDDNVAKDEDQVDAYLNEIAKIKVAWIDALALSAEGDLNLFADYIDANYGTGIEIEVLTEPKNDQPYYDKRFDADDILCVAYITDKADPDLSDIEKYVDRTNVFFRKAIKTWINPTVDFDDLLAIPVISIKKVALPTVPDSGVIPPEGNIGQQWVTYLSKWGYDGAVGYFDFQLIYHHD